MTGSDIAAIIVMAGGVLTALLNVVHGNMLRKGETSKLDAVTNAMSRVDASSARASSSLDKIADAFTGHLVELRTQGATNSSKLDLLLEDRS